MGLMLLKGGDLGFSLLALVNTHLFYFFNNVFPTLPLSKGRRFLRAPKALYTLCDYLKLNEVDNFNQE